MVREIVYPDGYLGRRALPFGLGGVVLAAVAGTGCIPTRRRTADRGQTPVGIGGQGGLVRRIGFSWLPPGYRVHTYRVGRSRQAIGADDPTVRNSSAEVTVYAAGLAPPLDWREKEGVGQWLESAAENRIHGHVTRWMTVGLTTRLRWQYQDNAWADLEFSGKQSDDGYILARRIAAGVQFDATERVRVPTRLNGLPVDLPLQDVTIHEISGSQWASTMVFGEQAPPLDDRTPYSCLVITIEAMNDRIRAVQMGDELLGPNTTIDGHPGRRDINGVGDDYRDRLKVFEVKDLLVQVAVHGERTQRLIGDDGSVKIFRQLDLFSSRTEWVEVQ